MSDISLLHYLLPPGPRVGKEMISADTRSTQWGDWHLYFHIFRLSGIWTLFNLTEHKHEGALQKVLEVRLTLGFSWLLSILYSAVLSCWYLAYLVLKYLSKTPLHWLQTLILPVCSAKQKQCSATSWALPFRSFVVLPIQYIALICKYFQDYILSNNLYKSFSLS